MPVRGVDRGVVVPGDPDRPVSRLRDRRVRADEPLRQPRSARLVAPRAAQRSAREPGVSVRERGVDGLRALPDCRTSTPGSSRRPSRSTRARACGARAASAPRSGGARRAQRARRGRARSQANRSRSARPSRSRSRTRSPGSVGLGLSANERRCSRSRRSPPRRAPGSRTRQNEGSTVTAASGCHSVHARDRPAPVRPARSGDERLGRAHDVPGVDRPAEVLAGVARPRAGSRRS